MMQKYITIASIQFAPKAGDIFNNLKIIEKRVGEAAKKGADFVVLPEICDIGYDLKIVKKYVAAIPNPSIKKLAMLAKENKVNIIAGLAEKRGNVLFNTAVLLDRTGRITAKYDKTHLCPFPSVEEHKIFRAGSRIFVKKVEGIKVGFSICYDIRFPEIYRKMALQGAEIIFHPTAFPLSRINTLVTCLCARTMENQFFMASANQCGRVGKALFGGSSMIIGPDGVVLAKAPKNKGAVISYRISLGDIQRSRKFHPVFSKRRPDIYK